MNINKIGLKFGLLACLLFFLFILPNPVAASWLFGKRNPVQINTPAASPEISEAEKNIALDKRQLWKEIFDRCQPELLEKNNTPFVFSPEEVAFLFNSESKTVKNPVLQDLSLSLVGDDILIAADFRRFIKGRISFSAQVVKNSKRLNLTISQAKFGIFPVPAALISKPLNKAIDQYFDCLYRHDTYRSADLNINNNIFTLKVEFNN